MSPLRAMLKLFAVFAVAVLLGASAASAASPSILRADAERRVERVESAFEALAAGGPSAAAVAEARRALDGAPPALRSSPLLADVDQMLALFDDPAVQRMMAPLVESGLLTGEGDFIDKSAEISERFTSLQGELGLDFELLG